MTDNEKNPNIQPCKTCKKEVAIETKICPDCGTKSPAITMKDQVVAVGVVLFVILSLSYCVSRPKEKYGDNAPITQKQQGITIQYSTIRQNLDSSMTDAQFKAFAKQLVGKTLSDQGYIEDVREKTFGGYEVWIDTDSPDVMMSVQDISFNVDEGTALTLRKDQYVAFSGRIKSVMKILGTAQVTLEDTSVKIIP